MSYSSYNSIRPLDNYDKALTFVSNTRPIRGVNRVPLGERRYHTAFDVLKNGEDVVCRLWDRPIVVFKPDGKIAITTGINTDGRVRAGASVDEAYFIANVLYKYLSPRPGADMVRRKVRLKLGDDTNLILEPGKTLELVPDENGRLRVVGDARLEGWQLKRSATNNVRKRYGEFYRYLKGISSLRADNVRVGYQAYPDVIAITQDEMSGIVHLRRRFLLEKAPMGPAVEWEWDHKTKIRKEIMVDRYAEWLANVESFLTFVSDTSENKHNSYYKAFLMVAYNAYFHAYSGPSGNGGVRETIYMCQRKDMLKTLDEILFKYYSQEVFDRVKLKVGQAPNNAYESWVNRVRKTS